MELSLVFSIDNAKLITYFIVGCHCNYVNRLIQPLKVMHSERSLKGIACNRRQISGMTAFLSCAASSTFPAIRDLNHRDRDFGSVDSFFCVITAFPSPH
jgi:hypothetical protein